MPIKLVKQPIGKLNLDGTTEGIAKKQPQPTIGSIPIEQLHAEVIPLVQKGIPIEKVMQAVQADARITDKQKAANIVAAIYQILGTKERK